MPNYGVVVDVTASSRFYYHVTADDRDDAISQARELLLIEFGKDWDIEQTNVVRVKTEV